MTRTLLLAAALTLLPAFASAGVRPAYGGTIRIGVGAPPRLAEGAQGPGDAVAERATAAPLLELDAAGALAPGALVEVPVPEADGRAFRLRLRPGLVDAAGRALGAADVAARLAALASSEARSPDGWVAAPVLGADAFAERRASLLAGVQVLSATELLVTLAFPLPEFPWVLATAPLALRGAGPFVALPRRAPTDPLVLAHNDRHHLGRPFADEVRVVAVDPRAAARLLEQGGLDLVLRPEAAGGRPGPILPALAATVAVLNPARLGAGTDAARSALAAVDRTELAHRFVRGAAEPLWTLVPSAILPGAPPAEPSPPGGPAPARLALLADSSAPDQRALAERLQVKLFDRGVRATVELADAARFRARLATGDYDVALLSVPVQAVRPALAAGQIAFAARGAQAARRTMAALAGLQGDAALLAAARAGRELDLVPLVASGARASLGPALQGLSPRADGAVDPGALWLLRGGAP